MTFYSVAQFMHTILFYYVLQLFGMSILLVGVWAVKEKEKDSININFQDVFTNFSKTAHIALDPAFILIVVGAITFIIGFTGCVGSLRENTYLLSMYAIFLAILLVMEISLGVLAFVLKDKGWIKDQATDGLRAFITHYREDPDQQNLIDWIQEDWLQCCGNFSQKIFIFDYSSFYLF